MHLMSQDQMKVLIAMTFFLNFDCLKYLMPIIIINYTKMKAMLAANSKY